MADKKQFPQKLKPPMEYMIEKIEKHTIVLEGLLDIVKEIDSKVDKMIAEVNVYKAHYALWDKGKRNDGSSASGEDRTI
jgi:hypothetical protein